MGRADMDTFVVGTYIFAYNGRTIPTNLAEAGVTSILQIPPLSLFIVSCVNCVGTVLCFWLAFLAKIQLYSPLGTVYYYTITYFKVTFDLPVTVKERDWMDGILKINKIYNY